MRRLATVWALSLAVGCVGSQGTVGGAASSARGSTVPSSTAAAASSSAASTELPSVQGLTFAGVSPPHEDKEPPFEGYYTATSFTFGADGAVGFIWSGSDIKESGTWVQEGDRVIVTSRNRTIELQLVEGGRALVVLQSKERLARR